LLSLLFLICSGAPDVTALQGLDELEASAFFRMEDDGSILMCSGKTLYHWNQSGALVNRIEIPDPDEGSFIHTASFDVETSLYLICSPKELLFYNRAGALQGEGYTMASGSRRDIVYRRLMPVADKYFGYLNQIDLWENPSSAFLVRFTFEKREDGYEVREIGRPFASFTPDQKRMNQIFKGHWILEDGNHGNLYLAFELSSYLRHFVPGAGGEMQEQERRIRLALPEYVPPPKAWNQTLRSQDEIFAWMSSWSRINGFYALADRFLVGYLVPDPDRPGESIQALQQISLSGRNIGRMRKQAGQLIGTHDGAAYIFRRDARGFEVVSF